MGFFKLFRCKSPEDWESKGDSLCQAQAWGEAKMEYETALSKLQRGASVNLEAKKRIELKIRRSREALAREHRQNGDSLREIKCFEEARELFALALELTEDSELRADLQKRLRETELQMIPEEELVIPELPDAAQTRPNAAFQEQEQEYFMALCAGLPGPVRKAYLSYGAVFKRGYLALNQGDFTLAAELLSQAWQENSTSESLIPLELATAYLNLEKYDQARVLLEEFIVCHPDVLPGYQLLCEIYWELKAFDQAEAIIATCPEELLESVAIYLLRGETLFQSGRFAEARSLYQGFLQRYGWHEPIAKALAKTHEALGRVHEARNLYAEIMNACSGCGARVDLFIKRKYALLSFESGQNTTKILEIFLSLAQEDPENAAEYYQKVSAIYAEQGDKIESGRFRRIAERHKTQNRRPS